MRNFLATGLNKGMSQFDKFIVVWEDESGFRVYDPFKKQKEAYDYMLEKLSEGKWACLSEKDKLPTIHYSQK